MTLGISSSVYAAPSLLEWQKIMESTMTPGSGCYTANYPSVVWMPVSCDRYSNTVPRNHQNYDAQIVGSVYHINSAYGSFPSESNYVDEKDSIKGNGWYSLQLNTNNFSTSVAGKSVTGWEQFIYSNPDNTIETGEGAVFVQYWVIDVGTIFPNCVINSVQWNSDGQGDCYINSSVTITGSTIDPSAIYQESISAQPSTNQDQATFCFNGTCNSATGPDYLGLGSGTRWATEEFNVFGWGGGSEAEFNYDTSTVMTLQVHDSVTAGVHSSVSCSLLKLLTGESNNMNEGSCSTTQFTITFSRPLA